MARCGPGSRRRADPPRRSRRARARPPPPGPVAPTSGRVAASAPQVRPVERQKSEQLRAGQAHQRAEHERRAAGAVEMAVHRRQGQRYRQRHLVAVDQVPEPLRRQQEGSRGHGTGDHRRADAPPARRAATRNAKTTARRPPVRATTIHIAGGMRSSSTENGANSVVKITGSGFHDGPEVVSREKWASSRPHTSHAQGS